MVSKKRVNKKLAPRRAVKKDVPAGAPTVLDQARMELRRAAQITLDVPTRWGHGLMGSLAKVEQLLNKLAKEKT